jgi:hypothetical protein
MSREKGNSTCCGGATGLEPATSCVAETPFSAELNGDGIVDLLYDTDEERGAAVAAMSASRQFSGSGEDSYMINGQARGGAVTGHSIIEATKAANAFCAQKGLLMMPRTANTEGSATWTAETSTLVFSCVREDDPEYKRPDMRKESPGK